MARLVVSLLLLLFQNTGAGNELLARQLPTGTPEVRGTWVARQVQDRDTGADSRIAMRMRLVDRRDRVNERQLTLLGLQGGPGQAVDGDRTLIHFSYPNDIAGTGFLVWQHDDEDDERFLYLPALGRVRRIAGSEAQESFVGSDFTYEDIGGREFDDYAYRLLDTSDTWPGPDGTRHPVFTLESRHRDDDARYPRVVSLVRQDTFMVVKADIHNRRSEVQKVFEVRRIENIDGYWTAVDLLMTDVLRRTRTELALETVEYDVGLSVEDFTRRALERGGGPLPTSGPGRITVRP